MRNSNTKIIKSAVKWHQIEGLLYFAQIKVAKSHQFHFHAFQSCVIFRVMNKNENEKKRIIKVQQQIRREE